MIRLLSTLKQASTDKDKAFKKGLKQLLGFNPRNLALYQQAFRHSSNSKKMNSNERLEFLGDAVLGLIVGEYLFKLYPYKDEGFLTQLRSRIVNRQSLHGMAIKFGLDQYLNATLSKKEKVKSSAYGDAFESLIGAIYLDKGFEATKKFVIERMVKNHFDLNELQQTNTDYKSQLQIHTQRNRQKLEYRLLEEKQSGKEKLYVIQVFIDDQPYVSFQHYSKRTAEQKAAQLTLEALQVI